jgi:hypothetical protein
MGGATVIESESELTQPLSLVTCTLYLVDVCGDAIGLAIALLLRSEDGDHK